MLNPSEGRAASIQAESRAQSRQALSVPNRLVTLTQASLADGKSLYEAGRFSEAATVLQQVIATYQAQGNALGAAIAYSNLALVYEQLSQWPQANQAITTSLSLLQFPANSPTDRAQLTILGQILEIQGKLQLAQGQAQSALETWQTATSIFTQIVDDAGVVRNQLNQAQAMQTLGFYRRAIQALKQMTASFQAELDAPLQVVALRSLGNTFRATGELQASYTALWDSLARAKRLQIPEAIASAHLGLGNTLQVAGKIDQALDQYQRALANTKDLTTKTQAQLNQLSLLIQTQRWTAAQTLWPTIEAPLSRLPLSHSSLYAQINYGRSLTRLRQGEVVPSPTESAIAQLLNQAIEQAQTLGDERAEAYALGNLGALYEQSQRWTRAQELTQQALTLAQANNASEITYELQWQLGRIHRAQGRSSAAILAYSAAVKTLQSLRSDLVAVSSEAQFSFRESIEPIYRELVELYLADDVAETNPQNIEMARQTIELLRLAELDNFFREACLKANSIPIDQIDQQAAIIYPIILPERLALIVSLPGKSLHYFSTPIDEAEVEATVSRFRQAITQGNTPDYRFLPEAQAAYRWLIRPFENELATQEIKTLVFVLDGVLRNMPMAALHDGDHYLIEHYSVAITPGFQLLPTQSLEDRDLNVLAAGISEENGGLPPLPAVVDELNQIQSKKTVLLNEAFTNDAFQTAVNETTYPIVHLATHGMFSSNLDETFLLAWGGDRININALRRLLQSTGLGRATPIELLILSACQTALGDERAALGLAGIATRSGARSTLATLWRINDQLTATLMEQFYQALAQPDVSKAEALRQAQRYILQNENQHPYYWAAHILVGNWL